MKGIACVVGIVIVSATIAQSETMESAKDFFPQQGTVKTFESPTGVGPTIIQTYKNYARFRDTDNVIALEEVILSGGKSDTSKHYYTVTDSHWKLIGTERTGGKYTTKFDPPLTWFHLPLKAGDTWEEKYVEITVGPHGKENRTYYKQAVKVYGKEVVSISGHNYPCWKIDYELFREGKKIKRSTSWIAKTYGTVKRVIHYQDGTVLEMIMTTFKPLNILIGT